MTWGNNSVFQLLIIQGSQAVTGLFLYNGLGAPGNPPQFAAVASGVTTDPFGNAITSSNILIQGNVITESGGIFRTSAVKPLLQLDGPHNAFLVYDSTGVAETVAPVATSDGFGSSVVAGLATYTTAAPFIALQLFGQAIQWQSGAALGGPWTADRSKIQDSGGVLSLISGTIGGASQANLTLASGAAANQSLIGAGSSPFALSNITAPSSSLTVNAVMLFGSSGHLKTVSTSDGNTYGTEWLIQRTTATQQFTLASAVAITGLSVALGVGSYHVRLKVFWVPSGVVGSTHVHNFAFVGTATSSALNGQCWQAQAASAVQQTALNNGTLASSLTSPTHVAFNGWTEFDLFITVSVAGTLTHTITLTTAGDDITTSPGTYWEVKPL